MDEIEANIKKFGEQQNLKPLQEYVANISLENLTSFVTERISFRNIQPIWNYLLQSFTDSSESHTKRYKIATTVLNIIEDSDTWDSHSNMILTRLCMELPQFKTNHLIGLYEFCIERIQTGNSVHTSWKDLLPELLNVLMENDFVTHNDIEMSGCDFKKHVINSLCMLNWSPDILTALTAMFRNVSLSKEEHLQVVNKLGNCIEKLASQEVPVITYQLLRLCSTQNSLCVFLRLQIYFSNRIYKNLGANLTLASSDTTDLDEISDANEHDCLEAESTVLFHIHNVAMLGHGSIDGYIKSLKTMLKAPEFVLHPFQLMALLTISTVLIYEEPTLDIIRSCIVRVVTEDSKKNDSFWFKDNVPTTMTISNVVSVVIENSIKERPLVILGLINLSFVLLGAGAVIGSKHIADAQWDLATFILIKLMKRKHQVSNPVLKELCNRIVTGQNVSHLTECLHKMCRNVTLCLIENQNIIIGLTEELLELPGAISCLIIDAILPLIKVSHTIRDNLIVLLRKALYHRNVETRQMAVSSYLKLLKNLRISNLAALSQSSASTSKYSFLTQMSLDREAHRTSNEFTNEALCLEVLGILKRCFMQQSEVRAELYEGLYDAVCVNSELGIPVLNMLWLHFRQFYNDDEDAKPPLLFDKIMVTKGVEVILQEPIGQLIYGLGRIVTKMKETHDETNPNITRFTVILDSLCDQMPKCELAHFNLDDGRDLLDTLPESQCGLLVLKQAMSVYEALMGYLIDSWSSQSNEYAQKINSLFVGYSRLVDHSKNLGKPKKAEGRKKTKDKDDTKSTSIASTSKIKPIIFKPAATVLDFETVEKILNLLHEPTVAWTNSGQANILKVKIEFHRYILSAIIQLIQAVKTSKYIEITHTKSVLKQFTDVSVVLHNRIIKRLTNAIDFDCATAVLAVNCFQDILAFIVMHYKDKLWFFLSVVGSKSMNEEIGDHLLPFIEIYQEFFETNESDCDADPEGKKLPILLVEIYKILVLNLPAQCPQVARVLDWLKKFTDENIMSNKLVGQVFITLLLTMNMKCKSSSGSYENVAIRLSEILGTVATDKPECPVQLKMLNEGTVLPSLASLTNILKSMLNDVDWLVQRFRAEYNMIIYPGGDKIERRKELLKNKEREVCCHLCQIIIVCSLVSNLTVPSGSNAEVVFKILIHLFQTLNSMTKYFLLISSKINPAFESARFERVLKLSGKPLSNKVYDFILYVEEDHTQNEESIAQMKKKTADPSTLKTKVLRETRLIPKLVFEMEQFGRCVITLSNKTKADLSKYVGLGTSRDFRIKIPALKEALDKIHVADTPDDPMDDVTNDSDETDMNENSQEEQTNIEVSMDVDEDSDKEHSPPPKKKAKKSK